MSRASLRIVEGAGLSWLVALIVALASIPFRAPAPLSGDGCEIADNLVDGGVMHAPGFALQSWLERALSLPPVADPLHDGTSRVIWLCLVAHALAAFFVADALRLLDARWFARIAGALTFAFFPTTWPLALEPEVFALAHAIFAAMMWQCAALWNVDYVRTATSTAGGGRDPDSRGVAKSGVALASSGAPTARVGVRSGVRSAIALGVVVGLGAAQHPITAIAAPAFLGSLVAIVMHGARERRVMHTGLAALAFLVVGAGLDFSLPLLHRASFTWPDAPVTDAADVVNHILRRGYGTFDLGSNLAVDVDTTNALSVLGHYALRLPLHALLALAGAVVAIRSHKRAALLIVATLALALFFLAAAQLPGNAAPYLERFSGVAVLPAAILAGLAVDALANRFHVAALVVAALACVNIAVAGVARSNLSERNEIDVTRAALGATLPTGAVWLSDSDREVLGGAFVLGVDGFHRRYPIAARDIRAWYWSEAAQHIEPRVPWPERPPLSTKDLVALVRGQGLVVAATDRNIVDPDHKRAHLRGLFWIVDGSDTGDVDDGTVAAASALCPFVAQLHARPLDAPGFGRLTELNFARAFDAASHVDDARGFADVARALERGEAASCQGSPTGGRLSGGGPASGSAGAGEGLATAPR